MPMRKPALSLHARFMALRAVNCEIETVERQLEALYEMRAAIQHDRLTLRRRRSSEQEVK